MINPGFLLEPTSDIMKKIADEQYYFVVITDTLEPLIFDNVSKNFFYVPEEVDYLKNYIWRYNHNRPTWVKFHEVNV